MNARMKGAVVATAVAGMFLAKGALAQASEGKSEAKTVRCEGINACKGKGACGGASHDCAGKNECKGKGWVEVSADECKAKGGTIKQ
ncbi:MAG: rane protein [Deltaproteobacteria bacterium]|jgi:uncharacterized membrane protein|nr:rane protein [Deltaproteobacteria bacterium]